MAASSGVAAAKGRGAFGGTAGPGLVSFEFSCRAEQRLLLPVGPCVEPGSNTKTDIDLLATVEDQKLLSMRQAPSSPKELVIPLIPSRRLRNLERPSDNTGLAPTADDTPSTEPAPLEPCSVEAEAVQELLQEAQQRQEQPEWGSGPPISIPLQLPDKDVATRPLPTPQDYEAMPVGQFGLAMLRGMGWSQGQGIRSTFPRVVPPVEHQPCPRGLGLGVEGASPGTPKSGDTLRGGLAVGDAVRIETRPHRGVEGKVEALEPETGRALVWLQLGGQLVAVHQHGLRPVSAGASSRPPEKGLEQGQGGDRLRGEDKAEGGLETEGSVKQRRGAFPGTRHWLRRDLWVRCVDRTFQRGRYYNCKLQVEALLSPDSCVCWTDDGRLVEASLETVVPRGNSDRVMAVLGEHTGKVGQILERRPECGRALVQLGRDPQVLLLPYDSICHYLGRSEDH